jgi:hypothetical protein
LNCARGPEKFARRNRRQFSEQDDSSPEKARDAGGDEDVPEMAQPAENDESDQGDDFAAVITPLRFFHFFDHVGRLPSQSVFRICSKNSWSDDSNPRLVAMALRMKTETEFHNQQFNVVRAKVLPIHLNELASSRFVDGESFNIVRFWTAHRVLQWILYCL